MSSPVADAFRAEAVRQREVALAAAACGDQHIVEASSLLAESYVRLARDVEHAERRARLTAVPPSLEMNP
jgi:hypothetical protein